MFIYSYNTAIIIGIVIGILIAIIIIIFTDIIIAINAIIIIAIIVHKILAIIIIMIIGIIIAITIVISTVIIIKINVTIVITINVTNSYNYSYYIILCSYIVYILDIILRLSGALLCFRASGAIFLRRIFLICNIIYNTYNI